MGDLSVFVQNQVKELVKRKYPHLELPAILLAVIDKVRRLDVTYYVDAEIQNMDSGGSYTARLHRHWYEYDLRLITNDGSEDGNFPALPAIRSKLELRQGAIVAVALPRGELLPAIIGEVTM